MAKVADSVEILSKTGKFTLPEIPPRSNKLTKIKDPLIAGPFSYEFGQNVSAPGTACLAEGRDTIVDGTANHVEGDTSTVDAGRGNHAEGIDTHINDGEGNHTEGISNVVNGNTNHVEGYINNLSGGLVNHLEGVINFSTNGMVNHLEGIDHTADNGIDHHLEGYSNTTIGGFTNHLEGSNNQTNAGINNTHLEGQFNTANIGSNNHLEGISNTIKEAYQTHVEGSNHGPISGFQGHIEGNGNVTSVDRAGQHLTGNQGYFKYCPNKSFADDTYNYSNQLAGGTEAPEEPGDGISVVERTLIPGKHPLGQVETFRFAADGWALSIIWPGRPNLPIGRFVTNDDHLSDCDLLGNCDRVLKLNQKKCTALGVTTSYSGVILNAGQSPGCQNNAYDQYHQPLTEINYNGTLYNWLIKQQVKITSEMVKILKNNTNQLPKQIAPHLDSSIQEELKVFWKNSDKFGVKTKVSNMKNKTTHIPYTDQDNFYEIAIKGLVIVKLDPDFLHRYPKRVDPGPHGLAVPGSLYPVLQYRFYYDEDGIGEYLTILL